MSQFHPVFRVIPIKVQCSKLGTFMVIIRVKIYNRKIKQNHIYMPPKNEKSNFESKTVKIAINVGQNYTLRNWKEKRNRK